MNIVELNKNIPVKFNTDVLIIGGGPAGVCAAIASARNGAKTMLIEQNGYCGGMATAGMVAPFMTCYDKDGKTMIIRGIFEEIVNRLIKYGGAIHPSKIAAASEFTSYIEKGHKHVTPFDFEVLKLVLDEMLTEAGVEILYHTAFVKSLVKNKQAYGAVIFSKSGMQAVKAKMVIDCSGDADYAADANVPFQKGDGKGVMQPATMFFRIGNVNSKLVNEDIHKNKDNFYRKDGVNYRSFHWHVSRAKQAGDWNLDRVSIGMFRGVKEDEWNINTSRIMDIDGTDNKSISKAEIEGRKQVHHIFAFIKKYIPGCQNSVLLCSAHQIGIRETRHIKGLYTLNTDDILNGKVSEDAIALASNSIDVHGKYGPKSNEYLVIKARWYGLPYRCLIPENIDNLLVAGRSISATSQAAGAIRVMPVCMAMGQAAGTAAAICIQKNIKLPNIDINKLRQMLIKQNVFLG